MIPKTQSTLAQSATCNGVGLHSGNAVTMTLKPAPPNHGVKFMRVDLPEKPLIPALFSRVVDTSLATVVGYDNVIVSTIEHLMASLNGFGIDNVLIELTNYEIPIMDGSAKCFAEMIGRAGVVSQKVPRQAFILREPIEIDDGERFVGVYPDHTYRISCSIDFPHPLIGAQSMEMEVTGAEFTAKVAGARTFGFVHDLETMRVFGLAKGGSLENAVVVDNDCVVNENGLRYPDEFVRHKLLDCVGDFSLLGMPILGHIKTRKSGHQFNHAFLEKFFASRDKWETGFLI